MFSISIWNDENFNADKICIKYNNYNRTVIYRLQNEELNIVSTTFVLHVVLQHVGLS